jgi:phosphate transport system permease protein
LIVGLVMVAGLLSLVVGEGLRVFWPEPVAVTEFKEGKAIIGPVIQRRIRPGSPASAPVYERQYQVGLREVNGQAYQWFDEGRISKETFSLEVMGLERMENGPAFIRPVRLTTSTGKVYQATDEVFAAELQAEISRASGLRNQVASLNKNDIGDLNSQMEKGHIELRRAEDLHQSVEAIKANLEQLNKAYTTLHNQAEALQKQASLAKLEVLDANQGAHVIPLSQIVRAWSPNQLTFWGRVNIFFSRLGEFISAEPREANTEGGVMPAIFGTLAMTVFMSLLVTPFGVIAAVYLREYAQQGFLLRFVRICVNNLAGVPSIVFGVFGLGFFVYVLGGTIDQLFFAEQLKYNNHSPVFGTGGLVWCSLTLALMTLPVVIVATEESLGAVPRGMREASLATGASKWQTILYVILPAAAPGILTGVILAMARGAGEVAPLMLVGVVKLAPTLPIDASAPFLHLDRKFMHLGFHVYDLGFQSPDSDAARPMVFATTLLLIVLVVCLNLGAIFIRNRLRARYKSASF